MNQSQRPRALIAVVAGVLLAIGFAIPNAFAQTLTVALPLDIESSDPTLRTRVETQIVIGQYAETLVTHDDDMNVVPLLAASWEAEDEVTYRFNIREGVRFHNGQLLTAEDVKFTFDRILDPDVGSSLLPFVRVIEEVEVVDPLTVVMHLASPDVTFVKNLTRSGWIVPRSAFGEMGAEEFARHPIGTGPFRFVRWERDELIELERFDDYWGGPAGVEQLIFRIIPEAATRLAALLSGEIDILEGLSPDSIELVDSSDMAEVRTVAGLLQKFIVLNTREAPFDDVRVRRAVNFAIDWDAINDGLFQGAGVPLHSPYTYRSFGYSDDVPDQYPYDPERARSLLTEAGYANGLDVVFRYPLGGGVTGMIGDIVEAVAAQLGEVGFRISLDGVDAGTWADTITANDPPLQHMMLGRTRDALADVGITIGLYFHSGTRAYWFSTSELDALIEHQATLVDPDARFEALKEIEQVLIDAAPWGFGYSPPVYFGVNNRVSGWTPRADRLMKLHSVTVADQ